MSSGQKKIIPNCILVSKQLQKSSAGHRPGISPHSGPHRCPASSRPGSWAQGSPSYSFQPHKSFSANGSCLFRNQQYQYHSSQGPANSGRTSGAGNRQRHTARMNLRLKLQRVSQGHDPLVSQVSTRQLSLKPGPCIWLLIIREAFLRCKRPNLAART